MVSFETQTTPFPYLSLYKDKPPEKSQKMPRLFPLFFLYFFLLYLTRDLPPARHPQRGDLISECPELGQPLFPLPRPLLVLVPSRRHRNWRGRYPSSGRLFLDILLPVPQRTRLRLALQQLLDVELRCRCWVRSHQRVEGVGLSGH